MINVPIKPLSVNQAWQGKRFRSKFYDTFERGCMLLLPKKVKIPDGLLTVCYEFGMSNSKADIDNPIKPFQDVLQKKYGFNDARIMELIVRKKIVKKGDEYIKFQIEEY